jgi:hypothetical protein
MHELHELKEMLMEEVGKIAKKGELTAGSLETVDKLLNSIKNACKIEMYDEYSEGEDYSQEGGVSYARGDQRRDARGRYSREGGYSYARGGRGGSRGGRGYSRAGYSYGDDSEEKVELLREMMQEAGSEEERRALQKIIRRMEQE